MYIFAFSRFSGVDKVFLCEQKLKLSIGDIFEFAGEYYINLGTEIGDNVSNIKKISFDETQVCLLKKNFISKNVLKFLKIFVEEYCTTYKNALSLFIPNNDIKKLLSYKCKFCTPSYSDLIKYGNKYYFSEKFYEGQHLIIVPDIWTGSNLFSGLTKDHKIFHGKDTIKNKTELFWHAKNGKVGNMISTHSQIFKDWKNLKLISILQPHKWYYKNHQDPRYDVAGVTRIMSKIYGSKIQFFEDLRLVV
ncbi:hypothetical protein [Candidatus Absconditicoccus praedator]|uniref:hypothetical protein n=1 Tax=Candidatus Absconditicoccus praedator TaxID=2735562 RepID=UPI001E64886D|nr:hypothetical protein [Candidatus Absconditicoccus praedator]UFX83509.1 hypothetical protein HLG78_05260 [Candidatus Absconditicoccus praedator]